MRRGIALLLALLCLAVSAAAQETGQEAAEPLITRFELVRSTDMPSRSYELFRLGDAFYLSRHSGPAVEIGEETVLELERIARRYNVRAWNGFSGSNPYVLDGEMFRLEMVCSDGTEISASGSNRFPSGYHEAADAMEELLSRQTSDPFASVAGTYRYEGGGFGGDFILTLDMDGRYSFSTGPLSSYLGGGEWFMSGAQLSLSEDGGMNLYNTLIPVVDALVFSAEDSDNFPAVMVPDGGRFLKVSPAEIIESVRPGAPLTVGADLPLRDVAEFYDIYDSSAFPPRCRRYHLYAQDGTRFFAYETREGENWPLEEEDITSAGLLEMTEAEWMEFLAYVRGGTVKPREDEPLDGDAGPWFSLYWQGDRPEYREYSFASWDMEAAFEAFCLRLSSDPDRTER